MPLSTGSLPRELPESGVTPGAGIWTSNLQALDTTVDASSGAQLSWQTVRGSACYSSRLSGGMLAIG
eukprot:8823-Heterococcus_DN1.PRE.2